MRFLNFLPGYLSVLRASGTSGADDADGILGGVRGGSGWSESRGTDLTPNQGRDVSWTSCTGPLMPLPVQALPAVLASVQTEPPAARKRGGTVDCTHAAPPARSDVKAPWPPRQPPHKCRL